MKHTIKRLSALFTMMYCACAVFATDYKGACGNNATWEFSSYSGTLKIDGGGEIWDFGTTYSERTPWYDHMASITKVVIGNRITRIGDYTFYGLQKMSSISIPNSVTSIGNGAFYGCKALSYISIPESVVDLGVECFISSGLESITIPNSIKEIKEETFQYCANLRRVSVGDGVELIGESAFEDCTALESVVFGANVKTVGESAFYRCRSLSSVTFNEGLIEIGSSAFNKCGMVSITIPNSVVSLGSTTFLENINLVNVHLGENVASLEHNLFTYCSSLRKINFPKSIKSISAAFTYCHNLSEIICEIPADELFSISSSTFSASVYDRCTLKVPFGAKEKYSTKSGWKEFKKIVEMRNDYQVQFMVDGMLFATDTILEGDTIIYPEVAEKEGCTFYWDSTLGMMPSQNVVIEGSYVPNKYLVTFKVDGGVIASDSLEYGTVIVVPDTPDREGYTFGGWSEVPETVPANDVTCEAGYVINSYTIIYIIDGEEYHRETLPYGSTVVSAEAPVKEGYTFCGWSGMPATMPASDVTVEGTFIRNIYLTIQQAGNGYVRQLVTEGTSYSFQIVSAEGWKVHAVTFNGEDLTGRIATEGYFTTPALFDDAVLNISFEQMMDDSAVNTRANTLKVRGNNGVLCISGVRQGDHIAVYDTRGILVAKQMAHADNVGIVVESGKTYLVAVEGIVVKMHL